MRGGEKAPRGCDFPGWPRSRVGHPLGQDGETEKPHPGKSLASATWGCERPGRRGNCYYKKTGPIVVLQGLY